MIGTKRFLQLAVASLLIFCGTVSHATTDEERAVLARLLVELDSLGRLIDSAERAANPADRIRFDYSGLRDDLHAVKDGIEDHLSSARRDPRTLPAIQGEYRR